MASAMKRDVLEWHCGEQIAEKWYQAHQRPGRGGILPGEDEQLHAMTKPDRLLQEIYDLPRTPRDKALRKVKQTITGKLAQAGVEMDRKNQCRLPDGSLLWIDVRECQLDIYRMHIGVPIPFGRYRTMERLSELSFIETDLERINGTDLAGFLARLQADQGEQFQWPLFSHDKSYPGYAWTKEARAFYYDRHKERLRCEEELNRRRAVRQQENAERHLCKNPFP